MRTIEECRNEIDAIDDEVANLLCRRMSLSKEIGEIKKTEGFKVNDSNRENEIVERIAEGKDEGWAIAEVYQTIFKVSKEVQE